MDNFHGQNVCVCFSHLKKSRKQLFSILTPSQQHKKPIGYISNLFSSEKLLLGSASSLSPFLRLSLNIRPGLFTRKESVFFTL